MLIPIDQNNTMTDGKHVCYKLLFYLPTVYPFIFAFSGGGRDLRNHCSMTQTNYSIDVLLVCFGNTNLRKTKKLQAITAVMKLILTRVVLYCLLYFPFVHRCYSVEEFLDSMVHPTTQNQYSISIYQIRYLILQVNLYVVLIVQTIR